MKKSEVVEPYFEDD